MNTLLVSGFGTNICVNKRKLIVENKLDNQRYEFYPHQIPYDSLILDGHTGSISFEALRWLMKHDVSVTMLNWNGNLLSTILPKEPVSAKLKINQYEAYLNPSKKRAIAEALVKEKVKQSINLLNELAKYYKETRPIKTANRNIHENVLTYEGNMAILYWQEVSKIFNKLYPEFRFTDRNGRRHSWNTNASDEINAMLNYGYAILESEVRKDLNAIGLDLSISFLHELDESRASLVYDVQELYRWLVDLSVIQLLEEKKLKKSDFIVTENYNIRLRETTAKALIEKMRLNFNSKAEYNDKYYSYQSILYENIRLLANYINGKSSNLRFEIPEFAIKRIDDVELRNKILNMKPEERRKLGMYRSTLWYRKRRIKEGKTIKLYKNFNGE